MIGATLIALIILQAATADIVTAAPPSKSKPDWANPPNAGDVQLALVRDTIMYSTNGRYNRYDYVVRGISCGSREALPEMPKAEPKAKGGNEIVLSLGDPDWPSYKIRCSFEYAEVRKKNRKHAPHYIPRIFSERELKRIPAKSWKKDEREMVYFGRNICRFMGRIPAPGECHYWMFEEAIESKPNSALPSIPIQQLTQAQCQTMSRGPQRGECDNSQFMLSPAAALDQRAMPNVGDVQMALRSRWIRDSSSGMHLFDYAVRNLSCDLPKSISETVDAGILKYNAGHGAPNYKVRCTFDHTSFERKSKERAFPGTPRIFSKSELESGPASRWQNTDASIYYMSRKTDMPEFYWLIPSFYMLEESP